MSTDPKKRQKKQERLAAKRKSKRHDLVKLKNTGMAERLDGAARFPILYSWVTEDFWSNGIGWACLSRQLPNNQVGFGMFLVDRYCLGVKNAVAEVTAKTTYESRIERKTRSSYIVRDMSPAAIRKLVEGAVAYAAALGFPPHPDYHKAKHIFGALDISEAHEEITFGQDGKPYFFAGPNDTPERCARIMKTLEQKCGPGGYHFTMPIGGHTRITQLDKEMDFDENEEAEGE